MTLGKNFRLPTDVKPAAYDADLRLDLNADRFDGELAIDVALGGARRAITLHAVGLEVREASAEAGTRTIAAKATADAESETVTLEFAEELPAGAARVRIAYRGAFSPGLRGLYRAGSIAVTQFEAADARRLFPCFDEPAFKAVWRLRVGGVPNQAIAISNGKVIRDDNDGNGGRRLTFAPTPLLSSYLVALIVGPLVASPVEVARDVPITTWTTPEKRQLTAFAQDIAAAVLPRLEDYFGLPYPFGKLDQIGVPDFEAGAMENAGAVTFREVALLADPATAPLAVQKRVAEVITHELAHQWFGNLVTMVWWDDLWLNEAFATWMAYKIVDDWRPSWRIWMDFEAGKGAALALDAMVSAPPDPRGREQRRGGGRIVRRDHLREGRRRAAHAGGVPGRGSLQGRDPAVHAAAPRGERDRRRSVGRAGRGVGAADPGDGERLDPADRVPADRRRAGDGGRRGGRADAAALLRGSERGGDGAATARRPSGWCRSCCASGT